MSNIKCFDCHKAIDMKEEYCNFYIKEKENEIYTVCLCKECLVKFDNDKTNDLTKCEDCGKELDDNYTEFRVGYEYINSKRKNKVVRLNLCSVCSEKE